MVSDLTLRHTILPLLYLVFLLSPFSTLSKQLAIPHSSSAVIAVLDPLATSGVITDMSAFFAAEKSALIAATGNNHEVPSGGPPHCGLEQTRIEM